MGLPWRKLQGTGFVFKGKPLQNCFSKGPSLSRKRFITHMSTHTSAQRWHPCRIMERLTACRSECSQPCTAQSEACATCKGCCPTNTNKLGFKQSTTQGCARQWVPVPVPRNHLYVPASPRRQGRTQSTHRLGQGGGWLSLLPALAAASQGPQAGRPPPGVAAAVRWARCGCPPAGTQVLHSSGLQHTGPQPCYGQNCKP